MLANPTPAAPSRPLPVRTATSSESVAQYRTGTLSRDIAEIRDVYDGPPAGSAPQTRDVQTSQSEKGCFNALFIAICEKLFGKAGH